MESLLQSTGLTKHYQVETGGIVRRTMTALRAVDGVDLAIEPGETLGLVGESGCGKSTLGRLLIRLIPPTAGRVIFDGQDLTSLNAKALRAARRGMQIVFQDPFGALNPRMSVEATVVEPLLIHGARRGPPVREAVTRILDLVGLPDSARHRFPHEFSGGQRQRIGIARALILRPKLVICDEPVSALDVSVQAQIVNLLSDLQAELGLTYLFIAHDLAVVKHISTRVAVMYLGKVVEIAEKRALYAQPLHPYTQALLVSVPVTHPSRRRRGRRAEPPISGDIPTALAPPSGCRFHPRCPHAMPICRTEEPAMRKLGACDTAGAGHQVACHLLPG
jgi:oligopeptide/dipeptide ABC transporter ATP-binding protein